MEKHQMSSKFRQRMAAFKKAKIEIEKTGLLVIPSVNGPELWDPKNKRYVGKFEY